MPEEKEKLGITAKKSDITEWYTQVVKKAALADYAPIKGCMIIRPYGYAIWEQIVGWFDKLLKARGVQNAYFPLFIPERFLKKEADHFEGFTPQVAWVTESGRDKLEERLAVRPTSETIMYDSYSKWIRGHTDLPLRINQWCNVVRWEGADTRPFLRTREFLWTETHTAHATREDAAQEVEAGLEDYRRLCEELLAIPVIKGKKPGHDKFPGAEYTTTLEAIMPDGKSLQMGTSHLLGQHFSKIFDITFSDKDGETKHVWQTSYGFTTRLLGALILIHGDDQGLVLPPAVAPYQLVIVPIYRNETKDAVIGRVKEIENRISDYRYVIDDSDHTPGWKFNEWEMKGVPLRMEIGPVEVKDNLATLVRRDTRKREKVSLDALENEIDRYLKDIQTALFQKAKQYIDNHIFNVASFEEMTAKLSASEGYVRGGWCGNEDCDGKVKENTGSQIIVLPYHEKIDAGADPKCQICGKQAKKIAYWARKY